MTTPSTPQRTNKSSIIKKTDELETGGWKLSFVYEKEESGTFRMLTVTGSKESGGNLMFTKAAGTNTLSFTNTEFDVELGKIILEQVSEILVTEG